ncbi:DUF2946 domain-containing protein [Rugamonas rubra]|nr:DUF2946 domain-containing protein [Rugamonas rubra]
MQSKFVRSKITAWLACFAILLSSLAPSFSHAVAAAKGEVWMEICTVDGMKFVKLGDEGAQSLPPLTKKSLQLEHCPYCSVHAGSPGILPSWNLLLPQAVSCATMPSLFYQSPRPLAVWAAAQSRAPPSLL